MGGATTTVLYPQGAKCPSLPNTFNRDRTFFPLILCCLCLFPAAPYYAGLCSSYPHCLETTELTEYAPVDLDYYMSTHMPLVAKNWTQYGLKSWKVVKFGDDAPYTIGATLEWGSQSDFQKAAGSESAKEVMGDIKNFCDKDPILATGEDVGTS